jgi:hypothetical protein
MSERRRGGPVPRVTTWKVPLALWLFGFVVKVVLSILVNDTVGSWVGGAFGFLALVSLGLLGWNRSREAREQEGARHPEP